MIRGSSAARWSGPDTACRLPASTPPPTVANAAAFAIATKASLRPPPGKKHAPSPIVGEAHRASRPPPPPPAPAAIVLPRAAGVGRSERANPVNGVAAAATAPPAAAVVVADSAGRAEDTKQRLHSVEVPRKRRETVGRPDVGGGSTNPRTVLASARVATPAARATRLVAPNIVAPISLRAVCRELSGCGSINHEYNKQ